MHILILARLSRSVIFQVKLPWPSGTSRRTSAKAPLVAQGSLVPPDQIWFKESKGAHPPSCASTQREYSTPERPIHSSSASLLAFLASNVSTFILAANFQA